MLQKLFLEGVEFSNSDLQVFETIYVWFELWQDTNPIVSHLIACFLN